MTTMRRRNVLEAGVVLATLPLAGCAPAPAAPGPAPTPPTGATDASGAPSSPPPASAEPPAVLAASEEVPAATLPATPSAVAELPKQDFARVIARVGKNHGHVFTVPLADVLAGVDKTYDLTGSAAHPHAVTLTAAQMVTLRAAEIARMRSTEGNGHSHRLWVRCAPAVDPPEWVSACKATFTGKDEHELVVPVADLALTVDRTYEVQGIAGHNHQLTLTAADFETLRRGGPVTLHTSRLPEDSHMHQVTVERLRKG